MGQYVHLLQGLDELFGVVAFVCTQRDGDGLITGQCLARIVDHGLGRFAPGITVGLGDHGIDHQAVAGVAQGVAHVAQFAGGVAFALEPGIGIGA